MNKSIKTILSMMLCAVMLVSCEKADPVVDDAQHNLSQEAKEYTCAELGELAAPLLSNSTKLSAITDEYLELILELDTSLISDYCVKLQTAGTEADQYGFFKSESEDNAKIIANQLSNYLQTLRDSWENFDYLPAEAPKIENSEVRISGKYVCYLIASESEKSDIFRMFETNTK